MSDNDKLNRATDAAKDAADTVANAVDQGRDAAADLAGDVTRTARKTADRGTDAIGDLAGAATDKVHDATDHVRDATEQIGRGVRRGSGVINRLHRVGVRSEYAYLGGFVSIGVSLASWLISRGKPADSKAQSDRWGIFVGHWAPTFFALGVALKLEEDS